ncbi:MAG: ferrous iron transport protein B [Chloroflexi bacterium]|nr:ferrous iron transport protein B [Chloroflexota bacterium]
MTQSTIKTEARPALVDYGPELEPHLAALTDLIIAQPALRAAYPPRWLAINLLEGDPDLQAQIARLPGGAEVLAEAARITSQVQGTTGEDADTLIADRRYRFIADLVSEAVTRPASASDTTSDRIDRVATHPWLGVPIFLALMWFVFQMTANVSGIYLDWIDGVINGPAARWIVALLGVARLGGGWLESLLIDGVIAGAGGVLAFVPVLMFLYFFIALLEDTGYMARAAFVMDRLMQLLGLHGKSFIPLLVGFGCSVPGIYATRTLEDRRDRILTGLLVPFMSCAARLPVYVLIGAAFFGANSGTLVFAMYLLGVLVAVLSGFVFRRTIFKRSEQLPFVMELPPFRRPSLSTIGRQVWDRTMGFVRSVWTVIVAASVIVWLLLNIPYRDGQPPALSDSLFGGVSRAIAPVFEPAGFGNWQASGSLVTGLVAKEVVISTMGQVYGVEAPDTEDAPAASHTFLGDLTEIASGFGQATLDTLKATASLLPGVNLMDDEAGTGDDQTALQAALHDHFTPRQAVAFSVFVLLYTPCMATVGAIRHEFGTRWMWFSMVYMLSVAWIAAVLTHQAGSLLGLG